jgi:hypothetical protein
MRRALLFSALIWLAPWTAAAQTAGPMTVERIHSGFLAAPEVKVTEIDHKTSELVGGFAGWNHDDTFLVGVGGYWLANGNHNDREMGYGGLVVQWLANGHGAAGFGAKALFGGGDATMTESIAVQIAQPPLPGAGGLVIRPPITRTELVRVREGFGIAEPELIGFVRLNSHLKLTGAAGYRFAGADRRGFDNFRLNGATGAVGLQISGG